MAAAVVLPRPRLEVADVLRAHGLAYRRAHTPSAQQAKVMRRLIACRTAALGGHVDTCDDCGHRVVSYNSCRDRHCPRCQASKRKQWLDARLERVLPVPHFHVVFTLPHELNPLALRNPAAIYNLLFAAASATLLQLAKNPKRLGAKIGFTAVLHTWGQNLLLHPHLHCVVTAGGLAPTGDCWIATRRDYFLPVKVMGRLFCGKFLHGLQQLYETGELHCAGSTAPLADPAVFAALRDQLYRRPWIVYAKPPFGGVKEVFKYLGRYSHRVAITNSRLVQMDDQHVCFNYKDYADASRWKLMQLDAVEFVRRFLLHVLPPRFVRIRHYGLMAGRNVDTLLARCRRLLTGVALPASAQTSTCPGPADQPPADATPAVRHCPRCRGVMIRLTLPPLPCLAGRIQSRAPAVLDTS